MLVSCFSCKNAFALKKASDNRTSRGLLNPPECEQLPCPWVFCEDGAVCLQQIWRLAICSSGHVLERNKSVPQRVVGLRILLPDSVHGIKAVNQKRFSPSTVVLQEVKYFNAASETKERFHVGS